MDIAKIQFSADELRLVTDARVILTKNRIMEEIYGFFGLLANSYGMLFAALSSAEGISHHPKISRGENYNGLPYVILDYPKHFTRDHIFAIRTMFLWGNDFSITLHLKGRYKALFGEALYENAALLKQHGWCMQVSGDEWQHHYTPATHTPVAGIAAHDLHAVMKDLPFTKLAFYFSLQQWEDAERKFSESFFNIIRALGFR
ncbi:MAG TPA: hypothetical protein PLR74_02205 [Agriterribacter sp.]|nr:hypothetical protein [Agriterribacter sp.]